MTARIANVNINERKQAFVALTAIFGVGRARAIEICEKAGVDPVTCVKDFTESELDTIRKLVESYEVEGDLRRKIAVDIKHLTDLKTHRGRRHQQGLPVRGQRSKTNARTRKRRKGGAVRTKK